MRRWISAFVVLAVAACGADAGEEMSDAPAATLAGDASSVLSMWRAGTPAYGVFVPSVGPMQDDDGNRLPAVYSADGAQALGENPLLDYLFLNLEPAWDGPAIDAMVEGLGRVPAVDRPVLLVRTQIPEEVGLEVIHTQIDEALTKGADGVVIPHIMTPGEAAEIVSFVEATGADVWTPSHTTGKILVALMIEDPSALELRAEIADTPGYSLLACGIGSLTGALGGDREAGEAGCMAVLAEGDRVGLANMMTAYTPESVVDRIERGYTGILMFPGEQLEASVQAGHEASGM